MIFNTLRGKAAVHSHALPDNIRLGISLLKGGFQLLQLSFFINFIKVTVGIYSRTALIRHNQNRPAVIAQPRNRKLKNVIGIIHAFHPYRPVFRKNFYLPLRAETSRKAVRIIHIIRPAIRKVRHALRQFLSAQILLQKSVPVK